MKPLTNAKHEAFAQALASGKTQIEAHALAGFKPHRGNASSLAQDKNIVERVQFLLNERERITAQSTAKAIEKAALTKEWVIEQLIENVKRASTAEPVRDGEGNPIGDYAYQGTVVNRALELLGKELGMFIDRKEIRSGPLDAKSDDELDAIIRGAAAEAKISLGIEGEGSATKH